MTIQRKIMSVTVDVPAVKIETDLDMPAVAFPPAILQAIGDLLNVPEDARRGLYVQLRQQANGYSFMSAMLKHQGKPKETAARLKKLVDHLGGVENALSELSVGMHSQLQDGLTESGNQALSIIVLREQIKELLHAATVVAQNHKTKEGRPRLAAIDLFVAVLMVLFERYTGKLPPLSTEWSERNSVQRPSPEAAAIVEFFKSVDAKIGENTIANRIVAVRRRYPANRLREAFAHCLMIPKTVRFH